MLIPLGLDTTRLSRLPRASFAIAGLCLIALLFTECSGVDREVQAAFEDCGRYYGEHPYLTIPAVLIERFGLEPGQPLPVPEDVSAEQVQLEQEQFEELAHALVAALDALPVLRFAFVPDRGALQPGWITYQFLHGGWLHLIGNLLIFLLVVGPFLEDVWGLLFFSGFYLLGGVAAALFQIPFMPASTPLVGASGSIAACLGAFLLRFAHRKVRMFWMPFFPFFWRLRFQFFVPAWLFALFGFAMDFLALRASDPTVGGGVANGAHVGGFLFGVVVALAVRWTGLESRISPEGAPEWKQGMALNRAADALAAGDVYGARSSIQEAIDKDPRSADARLELARLEAGQNNVLGTTDALEPIVAERLAAGDAEGVRSLMAEFRGLFQAERFRHATAYRLAEVVERDDPQLALKLLQSAGAAGGGLGAKALARAAQKLAAKEPERARELLDRAEPLAADPDLLARIRAVRATLPAVPGGDSAASEGADAPGAALREIRCRVSAVDGGHLTLVSPDGRAARLDPSRVAHLAAALLERFQAGGQERRNGVVLDLVLHASAPGPRVLLRIAGHDMGLAAHRPGIPPAVAFAEIVEAIQLEGATSWPDAARAQGKPFARFPDLAAYEQACYGGKVTA